MLERILASNSVVFYRSPQLAAVGVPHAFSTRLGGVSEHPFAALNLGNPSGVAQQDPAANISENYRRLHTAIGGENRQRFFAHQVHGATVLDPARSPQTDSIHGGCEVGRGDALFSDDPTALLSVRTADCVPVLLASTDGRQVAACHAGWRGVVAGVVLEALKSFGDPAHVIAAIGPSIGTDAFEVGPEVAAEFVNAFGESATRDIVKSGPDAYAFDDSSARRVAAKPHIDLKRALAIQLQSAGVTRIDTTDLCTVTRADEFFSHRRENGVTGRMAAVIGARL